MKQGDAMKVDGYGGVAWRHCGPVEEWIEETEEELEDGTIVYQERTRVAMAGWIRAHMVGDDRMFEFRESECHELDEGEFCHECGQIGCTGGPG